MKMPFGYQKITKLKICSEMLILSIIEESKNTNILHKKAILLKRKGCFFLLPLFAKVIKRGIFRITFHLNLPLVRNLAWTCLHMSLRTKKNRLLK